MRRMYFKCNSRCKSLKEKVWKKLTCCDAPSVIRESVTCVKSYSTRSHALKCGLYSLALND